MMKADELLKPEHANPPHSSMLLPRACLEHDTLVTKQWGEWLSLTGRD